MAFQVNISTKCFKEEKSKRTKVNKNWNKFKNVNYGSNYSRIFESSLKKKRKEKRRQTFKFYRSYFSHKVAAKDVRYEWISLQEPADRCCFPAGALTLGFTTECQGEKSAVGNISSLLWLINGCTFLWTQAFYQGRSLFIFCGKRYTGWCRAFGNLFLHEKCDDSWTF